MTTSWSEPALRATNHPKNPRNGLTETEIKEAIIHLAFYAGWPKAVSAMNVAKSIFNNQS